MRSESAYTASDIFMPISSNASKGWGCLQARLEDHRRQKAEQEAQQDEREVVRQQVRAALEARVKWLRAPDAILRALGVPVEMEAGNPFRADLPKTVRKARLTYHPDRHQVCCPLVTTLKLSFPLKT